MTAEVLRARTLAPEPAAATAPATTVTATAAEPWTPALAAEWDAFVRQAPGASFFHLAAWRRVVEEVFGHRAHYLVARRGDRGGPIAGVLPLFELRSLLFGRSLVSLPFAIAGGVAAADPHAAGALLAHARDLAEERRVDYLELRSERPLAPDLPTKDLYATFRADLALPVEELMRRMTKKRRQMITYAERAGFTARFAGPAELPVFYRMFAENMRQHGTPVYPRRFLEAILREYPEESNLLLVSHPSQGGEVVGGLFNIVFRGVVTPFYAGIAPASARLRGLYEFMCWRVLSWGKERGCHTFDFGRSKRGTGAFEYKERWGMDEVPLAYQYHLVRARELPNVSPANPRYQKAIALWRKLPHAVTDRLGPAIAKRIP